MAGDLYTVFGGSGFIGRYVVQQLAARGHRVRVAVRNPNLALFLKPSGAVGQIQLVQANVRNAESVARAVAGADGVVNLVGLLAESGHQTFKDVQAEGAATVARAAAAAGVRAFVQMSAIGADAASPARYARTKAEAEAAVRAALPQATILRPSVVFGPEDDFINRFARLARMLPVMPVVAGDTRFQPVYVADVAAAVVSALEAPAEVGGHVFELGGPRTYTMRDLLAYILDEAMLDRPLVEVPMAAAGLLASLTGWLPGAPLTSDQLLMLARDNVVSPTSADLRALGVSPTPLEAIAPSYLVQYRPKGRFSTKAA
ncbi:complex I NDUFA9 subunit family protein [Parapedomonas caeni]